LNPAENFEKIVIKPKQIEKNKSGLRLCCETNREGVGLPH
jgi:hypothetical protein